MSTNVYHLLPPTGAAAADPREPVSDAVLEVSGRILTLNGERRRLHSRLDELRSADPRLRRSRPRTLPLDPQRPLTIFSFEEAAADEAVSPLQVA